MSLPSGPHPRTLPFDRIVQNTYNLFNNNIFHHMSTHSTTPLASSTISPPAHYSNHLQEPIGDPLTEKPPNTFRIFSQNINGISPNNKFNKWKEILQSTVTHEIDFLSLSETNIEWRHTHVNNHIPQITKRFFRHSRLLTTTSSVKFERIFKPGGTASLTTNEWTGRILRCEADPSGLGRWTTTVMTGRKNRKIALINAYQVCKATINTCGITSCFAQQWHLLRAQGTELPDPRQSFWNDLHQHIATLQATSHKIILMGDFNTSISDHPTNPITRLQEKCLLTDAIAHFHNCHKHSSYSRGSTIIDFLLVSVDLLPCIKSSGYLPLHFFAYSDHRGLYADFNSDALFGGAPPKISKPTARFVKSRDSQTTSKFLQRLGTYWARHSIRTRITKLANALERKTAIEPVRRFAIKIDRDRTRGFLISERKCHRKERPPWSRPLHRLSRQYRYWQIFLSDLKLHRHSYNALIAIEDELEWRPEFYPTKKSDVLDFIKDTKRKLQALRKQATDTRSKDLQLQAQEAELEGDHHKARILRRLHKAETTHSAFLKLRRYLKPKNTGGVTKLELPINQPDGSTVFELTEDPDKIELACLERNKQHFAQAQGTPFTIPPLSQIEPSACGPISDAILEGRLQDLPFDVTSLPEAQQIILEELEQCIPTMSDSLVFEDFKRRFSIWREDTSTSPSGMYLSLYKALISSKYHDGLIDENILQEGEDIFMDIFLISNLACRYGFAFERWKEVVNCMINKKIDSFRLNQLRVIHLFEADYNLIIGLLFGRYMIHRICDNNLLHPSQWGRPNRECEDVLMIKELTYQVASMSRTDLATFDNDASSCYDRIVTRFALLCCRAHGVPEGPCNMTAEVLNNVVHKIKTAYGISEASYSNTPDSPIHGVGQGSQDGPSLWCVSSSVTFRGADRLAHGLTCVNPCHEIPRRAITHTRKLDGFVDDVTGWFNRMLHELRQRHPTLGLNDLFTTPHSQPILALTELAQGMQHDATVWQTFLDISGGKLAVEKCLYYLAHWRWTSDGSPELTPAVDIGCPISLQDANVAVPIPHYDVSDAHLTLGVWKSPSGNLQAHLRHLQSKSHHWTTSMRAAPLTKDEAFLSYSRIYIPSLRYGLGTCYFSMDDLGKIQKPAINVILPKMGFNRHLPRIVTFGPRNMGALGIPHLALEQGLQQIQFIGRHLRSPTSPLRSLFQIAIEWFRILCGYTSCPLADPSARTQHVEHASWFKSLQSFLHQTEYSLDIPNLYLPRLLRQHDQAIMSLSGTSFNPSELRTINRCRIFLRVTTLAEICTTDGTQIHPTVWRGEPPNHSFSTLLWPRQQRPQGVSWRIWRRFLTQVLRPASYTCYSTHLPLRQPLGSWYDHYSAERFWNWSFSPKSSALFRYDRMAKSFQGHPTTIVSHRIQADIDPEFCCYEIPPDAVPCEPRIREDSVSIPVRLTFNPPVQTTASTPLPCPYTDHILSRPGFTPHRAPSPQNWKDYHHLLPSWESALLPTTITPTVLDFIIQAHSHRASIYHCSDGSVHHEHGSFGWAFGPTNTLVFRHSGRAYGTPMDSYLAESYGLLSTSCFWFRLIKLALKRQRPHFKLYLYCDNKSLVKQVNNFRTFFDGSFRRALTPNYDVVYLIACVLQCFPDDTVQLKHVKGHQDLQQPTHQLPWPARLNIVADRAANEFTPDSVGPVPALFLPTAQIHLRDRFQTPILKRWSVSIRSNFYRSKYEHWLCRQFRWTRQTLHEIDFEGLNLVLRSIPTYVQRFVIKWINQSLPVRRRVHRFDKLTPPTCRSCPQIIECDRHFLRCPSPTRRTACHDAYTAIHDQVQRLHTEPTIHQTILYILAQAFDIPTCSPCITNASPLASQTTIGVEQFLKGRWSRTFRDYQERFYRRQLRPSTYSGDRWLKLTLSLLFTQLQNIWKCRNLQTHGSDQTLQDQLKRDQLALRVSALYAQLPNLLTHDRDAFEQLTKEEILSGPTSTIESWLRIAEPTIQQCIKDANKKLLSNQGDIRDYFEEASYIDSDASDTSLSYDTLEGSDTISFHTLASSSSSDSRLTISSGSTESADTQYSDSDSTCPSSD